MAESSSKPSGPVRQILTAFLLVMLTLYAGKVYIRAPEYRHIEACYLPHKVAHFFWVDAWGAIVPDDNASYLKHSRDLSQFFTACTERVSGWTWLRRIGTSSQDQQ